MTFRSAQELSSGRAEASAVTRIGRLSAAFALVLAVAVLFLLPTSADAQDPSLPDQVIIFVIDLSGSMNEGFDGNRSKLDVAKESFGEAFANVSPDAMIGIRVYGDQFAATSPASREENCTQDTRLVSPIERVDPEALIDDVFSFSARGDTAIALALDAANSDIPEGTLGTVVLFSDGRDECFDADLDGDPEVGPSYGEDPCIVAQRIAGDGVDLRIDRIETVGFGADAAAEQELRCIADSTGGSYTAIETPADAQEVLPELLAVISSPREAQRLGGTAIVGSESQEGAPDFARLDSGVGDGRYTDTIAMNTEKWYRTSPYGPGAGTFTATAFGLPAQEGLDFDLRMFVPSSDQTFFTSQGDDDAGLPRRPTASIRCPGCSITGLSEDVEVFWIVSLSSENPALGGTYDLELLTEGTAFGGSETGCVEPQACWYEQQIPIREAAIEDASAELAALGPVETDDGGEIVIPDLAPLQRDLASQKAALDTAESEAVDAEENASTTSDRASALQRQADAREEGTSFLLPLLLGFVGLVAGAGSFFVGRKPEELAPAVVDTSTASPPPPPPDSDVVGRVTTAPPPPPSVEAAPTSPGTEAVPPPPRVEGGPASPPGAEAVPPPPGVEGAVSSPGVEASGVPPNAETVRWRSAAPQSPSETPTAITPVEVPESPPIIEPLEVPEAKTVVEPLEVPEAPPVIEPLDGPEKTLDARPATGSITPGWYTNPTNSEQLRWWDGAAWTSHILGADGGEVV